jgi:hypothetical protein
LAVEEERLEPGQVIMLLVVIGFLGGAFGIFG